MTHRFVDVNDPLPEGWELVQIIHEGDELVDPQCSCDGAMSRDRSDSGHTEWSCVQCGGFAVFEPGFDTNDTTVQGRVIRQANCPIDEEEEV